jgi:hypothetical protein
LIGDVERELYERTLQIKERAYAPYSAPATGRCSRV